MRWVHCFEWDLHKDNENVIYSDDKPLLESVKWNRCNQPHLIDIASGFVVL